MFAVLEIPGFRLRAVERLREVSIRTGAVLVEAHGRRSRVVACDPVAAGAGVRVGMTAAAALAKSDHLTLLEPDAGAEVAAGRLLFAAAGRLSPRVERSGPGWVTVDLRGRDLTALPGELERTVEALAGGGLPTRVGVARTPFLAKVAALRADPVQWVGDPAGGGPIGQSMEAFLAATPVADALAGWDWDGGGGRFVTLMADWGVASLAAFAALDRAAVTARMGAAGGDLHDEVRGRRARLLRIDPPAPEFAVELEPEQPIERLEPLLFVIRRLLETLSAELSAAVLAAATVRIGLDPERGASWEAVLDLPEPTHRVDPIFAILESRLEGVRTESAIVRVRLSLEPHEKIRRQRDLFAASLEDPHRFADTLARLRGLFGAAGYGSPRRDDRHDPDAFVLEEPRAWDDSINKLDTKKPLDEEGAGGPIEVLRRIARTAEVLPLREDRGPVLRRFRPAREVRVVCDREGLPRRILKGRPSGEIVDLRGPWIVSGAWWDRGGWSRVEWDIEIAGGGGLYRLVDCSGEGWIVEGMYD